LYGYFVVGSFFLDGQNRMVSLVVATSTACTDGTGSPCYQWESSEEEATTYLIGSWAWYSTLDRLESVFSAAK